MTRLVVVDIKTMKTEIGIEVKVKIKKKTLRIIRKM